MSPKGLSSTHVPTLSCWKTLTSTFAGFCSLAVIELFFFFWKKSVEQIFFPYGYMRNWRLKNLIPLDMAGCDGDAGCLYESGYNKRMKKEQETRNALNFQKKYVRVFCM